MKKRNLFHKHWISEKLSSVSPRTRHYRRSLFSILVFGVLLSGCSGLLAKDIVPIQHTAAEPTFEQHEIVTGTAKHQTILTAFLLGGTIADLAVVNIDENNDRHLHIYAFSDRTWVPKLDATLRPEVLFVDVANINGHDRLITYEHGQLNWFDLESATEHVLVIVPSMIPPPNDNIPHVDITHDVNGDARDDLVVPDSDGFWVFIQTKNSAFADPVKLGPPTEVDRIYDADEYRHTPWNQSRIHEMDYNRDGRSDLVFWNTDHFEVHHQDEHGLFSPVATIFTTDVTFDSDKLTSLAAPYGVRRRRRDHQPTGNLTGRVLHALTDMNGDGTADLGIFSLKGGSLWHMHSTYEVHFGTPTPDGGTVFASDIGTTLQSDGIPFGLEQHDFDHDGQIDMMFTTINPEIFKVIGMIIDSLLTGSASRDIKFYRMEGGSYPDKPNATGKIKTYPGKSGEKAISASMLIGDVNGDRRLDLLLQNGRKELRVFLGVSGPDLFDRKPQKVAVATPNGEEYTWLVDFNKDSKQDVLMHHASSTEPHRVTILISR